METKFNSIKAYLESKQQIAQDAFEVWLSLENDLNFKAGQYIWLILQEMKFPDLSGNRRAFSIASSPNQKNRIRLIYRQSNSGYKKSLESLELGSSLEIQGPFGFFVLPDSKQDIVLVAGGVGVTPFLSMISQLVEDNINLNIELIISNKSSERSIDLEQLAQTAATHSNISVTNIIGRISTPEIEAIKDREKKLWYVSGPQPMVLNVTQQLLSKGVLQQELMFDEFYGFGATDESSASLEELIDKTIELDEYRLAVQGSMEHIIITDIDGFIRYANKAAEEMTGFTLEEMKGNTPRLWGGLMDKGLYQKFWHTIKLEKKPFEAELKNRKKSGEVYIAKSKTSPIKNDHGKLVGFVGHEDDITQVKKIMEEVENEKAKDEALLASMAEGVVSLDVEGRVSYINRAALDIVGYEFDDVFGKLWVLDLPKTVDEKGKEIDVSKRACLVAVRENRTVKAEYYYQRKDGVNVPVRVTASPTLLNNQIIGVVVVFEDMTKDKDLDRVKDEFVSMASHELRTPLTAIDGIVSMILDGDYGDISGDIKTALVDVNTSSERLIHLVNDLLNLSRIQAGRLKYVITTFNISELVNRIENLFKKISQEKKIIINSICPQEFWIQADKDKVEQIIVNLINNAIKFTDEGQITIQVSNINQMALIKVIDSGIGMSQEDSEKIFGRFIQVGSQNGRPAGTGLGLYLSKQMAQKMGGDLWLDSSQENKGSVFALSLPFPNTEPASIAISSIEEETTLN